MYTVSSAKQMMMSKKANIDFNIQRLTWRYTLMESSKFEVCALATENDIWEIKYGELFIVLRIFVSSGRKRDVTYLEIFKLSSVI